MLLISLTFNDPIHGPQHVEVVRPYGMGSGDYHVYVNDYFRGQIVKYYTGWQHFIKCDTLSQDDIDAIMDEVRRVGE